MKGKEVSLLFSCQLSESRINKIKDCTDLSMTELTYKDITEKSLGLLLRKQSYYSITACFIMMAIELQDNRHLQIQRSL